MGPFKTKVGAGHLEQGCLKVDVGVFEPRTFELGDKHPKHYLDYP